jgi:DNA-binding ferritin-like protein
VRRNRPALTPEAREHQLVSLAVDLAERQLMDGTASSQVITHYLKIGSTKERIEKEILEKQKDLIDAKTQSLQSAQRIEELYKNALDAMRNYGGHGDPDDY